MGEVGGVRRFVGKRKTLKKLFSWRLLRREWGLWESLVGGWVGKSWDEGWEKYHVYMTSQPPYVMLC